MLDQKAYTPAIEYYQRIVDGYPSSSDADEAIYKIGISHLQAGQYERAQTYFVNVVSKSSNPRTKQMARVGLARVLLQLKRYPNAMDALNQVLDEADKDIAAEAQFLLGEGYKGQNDFKSAAVAFLKVKYLHGSESTWAARAIYEAGLCNEQLERIDDARRLYSSILKEYPGESTFVDKAKERLNALVGK